MSPSKSRVVEALCFLLLAEKHPTPKRVRHVGQRQVFTSRWRFILNEYNSIRSRLVNSQALLEGTNLVLYPINETTLVRGRVGGREGGRESVYITLFFTG